MDEQLSEHTQAAPQSTTKGTTDAIPWYSLNLKSLRRARLMRAILIGLVVGTISVVPLWRVCWYLPVYAAIDFLPMKDEAGKWQPGWKWIDGKEIRIYQLPDLPSGKADEVAIGVKELVDDLNLDIRVTVLPMPPAVLDAYRQSLLIKKVNGVPVECVSYARLAARLVSLRKNDPHADMLVVNAPLAECWWAHGMASFPRGLGVFQEANVSVHLGKHETGHLLGYLQHDTLPLFVLGYPWEGSPWTRDTLMVLYGGSNTLSPRSRDALHYFWRGLEARRGVHYFRTSK